MVRSFRVQGTFHKKVTFLYVLPYMVREATFLFNGRAIKTGGGGKDRPLRGKKISDSH